MSILNRSKERVHPIKNAFADLTNYLSAKRDAFILVETPNSSCLETVSIHPSVRRLDLRSASGYRVNRIVKSHFSAYVSPSVRGSHFSVMNQLLLEFKFFLWTQNSLVLSNIGKESKDGNSHIKPKRYAFIIL